MGGIAQNGTVVVDGDNLIIQGVSPNGIAIQGEVAWVAAPWKLMTYAASQGAQQGNAASLTLDTTGCNLIVVMTAYYTPTYNLSDNMQNVWSLAINTGSFPVSDIRYCLRPTTNENHVFTLNANFQVFTVAAFRGRTNDFTPDQSQQATNVDGSPITLPGITPTAPNTVAVTTVGHGYADAAIDSGFTIISSFPRNSNYGMATAYLFIPGAASIAPTWTLTNVVSVGTTAATLVSFNSSTDTFVRGKTK